MTSIIGIRCKDGVVVAADSAATFGDGAYLRTIEQPTQKIDIIGGKVIVAGTGFVGHQQRFTAKVKELWDANKLGGAQSSVDIGRLLSHTAVNDFAQTTTPPMMSKIPFSALVAYPAKNQPNLCEFFGHLGFQPEVKEIDKLWWASNGGGQPITDPFLALLRQVYWPEYPPDIEGGKFMAYWALRHACELNPGGIKEPIHIAVLAAEKGNLAARMLGVDELREVHDIVGDAIKHMATFRDVLEGKSETTIAPVAPGKSA